MDERMRELEREATNPQGVRALLEHLSREGMFFFCEECGACVPPMARDRHQYEHDYARVVEDERNRVMARNKALWDQFDRELEENVKRTEEENARLEARGGMRIVTIPPRPPQVPRPPGDPAPGGLRAGVVAARPANEPLFHRLIARPSESYAFFTDVGEGQTNLETNGMLPAASHFYVFGLSLIPDEGADPAAVAAIRNEGRVRFARGRSVYDSPTWVSHDLPACAVLSRREFTGAEVIPGGHGLAGEVPMHRMTVAGRPIELLALEAFGVFLEVPFWEGPSVGLTCILHGLRLRGLVG